MKKLFTILLAVSMVVTMTLPAFAATELTGNSAADKGAGDYTIGVSGTYTPSAAAGDVVSADIAWQGLSFTYTAGDSTYNPDDHTTTTEDGSWSDNRGSITVTNHSNVGIQASFHFDKAEGVDEDLYGNFYLSTTASALIDETPFVLLDSAVGSTVANAPSKSIYFKVSDGAISKDEKLGTITVTISKETWTTVDSTDGFLDALRAGGRIKLGANIELGTIGEIHDPHFDNPVDLDLNGYTLSGYSEVGASIGSLGMQNDLTVRDSSTAQNGKIEDKTEDGYGVFAMYTAAGKYTVQSGTVSGVGSAISVSDAGYTVVINGGKIEGKIGISASDGSFVTVNGGIVSGSELGIDAKNATVTVNGGKVTGTGTNALCMSGSKTISVTGGEISGATVSLYLAGENTLEMSGGTVGSIAVSANSTANISGGTVSGRVDVASYNGQLGVVNVTGGTFTGAFDIHGTLTISGGTFNGTLSTSDNGTITVTGGTFDKDPTSYVATGYTATKDTTTGTWTVTANA